MPDRAGTYEIRYVTGQDSEILARRTVVALPVRVELSAPDQAPAGARVKVAWSGAPNNPGDFLTIVRPDAEKGAYTEYFMRATPTPNPPACRAAAARPIRAALRHGADQRGPGAPSDLASATRATLEARRAPAGSRIKLSWAGPNNESDFITVVVPDAEKGATRTTSNTKSTDRSEAGLNCRRGRVPTNSLCRRRLQRDLRQAPHRRQRRAGLARCARDRPRRRAHPRQMDRSQQRRRLHHRRKAGCRTRRLHHYFGAKGSDPDDGRLVLPARPGDYEVRYVTGGEARVLARAPIKVQPFTITLDAPAECRRRQGVRVQVDRPPAPDNFVTMVKPSDDPDAAGQTVNVDARRRTALHRPVGAWHLRAALRRAGAQAGDGEEDDRGAMSGKSGRACNSPYLARAECASVAHRGTGARPADRQLFGTHRIHGAVLRLTNGPQRTRLPGRPAHPGPDAHAVRRHEGDGTRRCSPPLVLVVGSDIYVYNSRSGARLSHDQFRADRTNGFYGMTAISHIGPTLAYLARIKANGDARWKQAAVFQAHIEKVRALNRRAADNWLDALKISRPGTPARRRSATWWTTPAAGR